MLLWMSSGACEFLVAGLCERGVDLAGQIRSPRPMGWKEFVANLVDALAWPAAVAFIVFLLREPLRRAIRGIRKVGYRGLEAEFGEVVQEAEISAADVDLPQPVGPAGEPALSTELSQEIATAPRAAVIEA